MYQLYTTLEVKIGVIFATLWGILDFLLGGIDVPIMALTLLIILDFLTGVASACKRGELCSSKGAKGLFKKAGIFGCIMLAFTLDTAMGTHTFRGMVISGFAVIEALSLVENFDKLGYGEFIPPFLRRKIEQLQDQKGLR